MQKFGAPVSITLVIGKALADLLSLFDPRPGLPDGFRYREDLLDAGEERALVAEIARLPFKAFTFHGFFGKRRVVSFGWRYDFNEAKLREAEPIPEVFHPVREKAARFAGLDPSAFEQLLVTEYEPRAAIGWHRDRPVFGEVIGVSLLAECTLRFRRKVGAQWRRASLALTPRSGYLLSGPARDQWEHSIPALEQLRYSLTFRNFRPSSSP